MLTVAKPFLPPLDTYAAKLAGAWGRGWVTNHGPLLAELESRLQDTFGARHVCCVASGTQALTLALRALRLAGDIVVTAYSHLATASAIIQAGCRPVFCDIEADGWNLDPAALEAALTPATTAILATHVYGLPCHTAAIREIADRHGLKVVYDAAHAFGVELDGTSLLTRGDAAAISFHATKVFHTVEGGAVVTHNAAVAERVKLLRNFGLPASTDTVPPELGANAKNSELHAAMGLAVLPHVPTLLARRRQLHADYRNAFAGLPLTLAEAPSGVIWNHAYFPVRLSSPAARAEVQQALAEAGIEARRYFHPALNTLPEFSGQSCPRAEAAADTTLGLPCHHDVTLPDVERIAQILTDCLVRQPVA